MFGQKDKIGIYMRLSKDDEKSGESASIEHQRKMLRKYVAEQGGTVTKEYADDGYSGTNFERPAIQRLLEDAKTGVIDTIVVKDLSRFGRNYIQIGQFLDYIFPAYGIRFLALSDHVDTSDRTSTAMDMMPIMNVFNEWHAANTSKKIRAVLDASRRAGKYTGWSYPYGYLAGTDERRTAVIDRVAANVVVRIYDLRLQGNSYRKIAQILSDEGTPNPAVYFVRSDGKKQDRKCSPFWNAKTVMQILSDPTYLGHTVQHKTTNVSYKNRRVITVPLSERIVKENAHEPIVSQTVWDRVQKMNASCPRGRTDRKNCLHLFSGLLVCADCGKKLKYKTAPRSKSGGFFLCRTYSELGKKYCSSHKISETSVERLLKYELQSMLGGSKIDEKRESERFCRAYDRQTGKGDDAARKQLKSYERRLEELDRLICAAFEEKVFGSLSRESCAQLLEHYQAEKRVVESEIKTLQNQISHSRNEICSAEKYIERMKQYFSCNELTRGMCLRLIESVTVGERDGVLMLEICYRFLPPRGNGDRSL